MKFRKALDKAGQKGPQRPPADPHQPEPASPATPAPESAASALTPSETAPRETPKDWVSPVYSVSTAKEADRKKALLNRCVGLFANIPAVDHYKVLRTQIQHHARAADLNTIMITSAVAGEGKTLTAINLGLTFAREYDQTALLVDCDLKNQTIHEYMGYDSDHGIVDYLLDDRPLPELIVWPKVEKLTAISGGRSVQDSAEMLDSPRMRTLVHEMKTRYENRHIIFDVPSVLDGADAIVFAPLVDGIIVVVAADRTPAPEVQKAVELLPREKLIGTVLNRFGKKMRV